MEFNEQEFVKDMTTAAFGAMFKCFEEVWCPAGKDKNGNQKNSGAKDPLSAMMGTLLKTTMAQQQAELDKALKKSIY